MKKIAILITTLLVSASGLAGAATLSKTTLSSAWRAKSYSGLQLSHDMNIVYTGEDVSVKHAGVQQLAVA